MTYKTTVRSVTEYASPVGPHWPLPPASTASRKSRTLPCGRRQVTTKWPHPSLTRRIPDSTCSRPHRLSLPPNTRCLSPGRPSRPPSTHCPPNGLPQTTPELYSDRHFLPKLTPYTSPEDDPLTREEFRSLRDRLHKDAVSQTVSNLAVSGVLGQRPPAIHPSEESLARETRRTLSQLSSGYSRFLNTYLARLDSCVDPDCPECNSHPHTTAHLFCCSANPSDLTLLDLWTAPCQAAAFLRLPTL